MKLERTKKLETPRTGLETPLSSLEPRESVDPFAQTSRSHHSLAAKALMGAVTGYQRHISPLKGGQTCRFYPSCSQYALEAIRKHGATKGTFLAVRRVLKCQPLHPGGFDPVP